MGPAHRRPQCRALPPHLVGFPGYNLLYPGALGRPTQYRALPDLTITPTPCEKSPLRGSQARLRTTLDMELSCAEQTLCIAERGEHDILKVLPSLG